MQAERVKNIINNIDPDSVTKPMGVFHYYRPTIDTMLQQTGASLCGYMQMHEALTSYKILNQLALSKVEARRRPIRQLIVDAAEKLWDGFDPYPVEVKNIFGQVVSYETNPAVPVADHWAVFRDRFCPTSKLHQVLFPAAKLAQNPLSAHPQHGYEWLPDPTMRLTTAKHFSRVDDDWVTATTLQMLFDLVDYRDSDIYKTAVYGGNVTAWIEAAKDWHTQRLDAELASGAVMNMDQVTLDQRWQNQGMHRGIANLRERLGITRNPAHLHDCSEHFQALHRSKFAFEHPSPTYQYLPDATEASVNKHFHRIVRKACNRCPESSYLFFPIGFDGLLEHMRCHHPVEFWADTFHLLG